MLESIRFPDLAAAYTARALIVNILPQNILQPSFASRLRPALFPVSTQRTLCPPLRASTLDQFEIELCHER